MRENLVLTLLSFKREKMEKVNLSASKIKKLSECSWLFWAIYFLRVPDESGLAASRGSLCHTIFEVLLNKRHKSHYENIIKQGNASSDPAIWKLILKLAKKYNIVEQDDL